MRSLRREDSCLFSYSIHFLLFLLYFLCPSSLDGLLFSSDRIPLSSSSGFLANAQPSSLYLQVAAGTGTGGYNGDNKPATSAQLRFDGSNRGGIFGNSNGVLYIGDSDNCVLRKIDLMGIVTKIAGTGTIGSGGATGAATSIDIWNPWYITGDTMGSFLYFSDYLFIWKYRLSDGLLSRYAGTIPFSAGFSADGQQATSAVFNQLCGISLGLAGVLYISDAFNNRVRIVAVNGILTTFAGSGPNGAAGDYAGDGGLAVSTSCKLAYPHDVYADTLGNVFIADGGNSRVRKLDSSGIIKTFAGGGAGGDGGQATSASLSNAIYNVKGDRLGNIYITDNCRIRVVNTAGIISAIVGTGTCGSTMTFSDALFSQIRAVYGLWVSSSFDVYFAETPGIIHKTVSVPLISEDTRFLQVVAGTGVAGYNNDNQPATSAQLNLNINAGGGVFGDSSGVIYVTDTASYRVRRISVQGIITTIAGTGTLGAGNGIGGAGTSVSVGYLWHVTGDTMGTFLYFSDDRYVWKYQISDGTVTRYAGAIPFSDTFNNDGLQATATTFYNPLGISLSVMGLLYVSDKGNNRVRVIATNGIVSTFAGSGPNNGATGGYAGDDGLAVSTNCKLNNPFGVYADTIGNVFIADTDNSRIRKVDSSGIIRTFAGGGAGGDGGQATSASLSNAIYDVKGDRLGNIYITDNCKIRIVHTSGIIDTVAGTGTCGTTLTFSSVTSSIQRVFGLWLSTNLNVVFTEAPGLIRKIVSVAFPTSQPSQRPSSQPSAQPSAQPSYQPVPHPSSQPSIRPSAGPSTQPSCQPVSRPSVQPSNPPSTSPSCQPSCRPSGQPSNRPSLGPSTQPSCQPVSRPSTQPSNLPSALPSAQPSCQPSSRPSGKPSNRPSAGPTAQPSRPPSSRPSGQPSNRPSALPSAPPSFKPSSRPSSPPSGKPSNRPSAGPTAQPSRPPSSRPSGQPSNRPSALPSAPPSFKPSSRPSSPPSNSPSVEPSAVPSCQPASPPSALPSNRPSAVPSAQPSSQPVSRPSAQPSNRPSVSPSTQPSCQPVSSPSAQPSNRPSGLPSTQPSCQPSSHPSDNPSNPPSAGPTAQPSRQPSSRPSGQPSNRPSALPSTQPSCRPSSRPSSSPSNSPSMEPSAVPTCRPAARPSGQPSRRPSTLPSTQPSSQPVSRPSAQPSNRPSVSPSTQPSCQPVSRPSAQPSNRPSGLPSTQPSCQPSSHPSDNPSNPPSAGPTAQPTSQPSSRPSVSHLIVQALCLPLNPLVDHLLFHRVHR
jgi:hypothetical protein